jgi:hypothetical protein
VTDTEERGMTKENKEVWTWAEFLSKADEGSKDSDSYGAEPKDFNGYTSYPQARKMAGGAGYMDVLPDVQRLATTVEDLVAADLFQVTFTSRWEVSGAEVDMGRFLAGEPECMIESEPIRISRSGRAVRIAVPVNYSASVPADAVKRRGAAIMALVDLLARAQHPVEIWAAICNSREQRGAGRTVILVKVQAANEPLDMGRVMFALAHPAMLRQLGFSAENTFPPAVRKAMGYVKYGGYGGAPFDVRASDFDETDGTTITLPPFGTGSRDQWLEPQALAWIREQIDRIFA